MAQNNKNRYNWFNQSNQTQEGEHKLPFFKTPKFKKQSKISWKIFKILAILFIISISLVGCVQSLSIKTDTHTGSGLEVFSNKEEVAPFVATIDYNGKVFTQNTADNYWLQSSTELKEVHEEIDVNGGNITTWKTHNRAVRYIGERKNVNDIIAKTTIDGKKVPLVASSSETDSARNVKFSPEKILNVYSLVITPVPNKADEVTVKPEIFTIDFSDAVAVWEKEHKSTDMSKDAPITYNTWAYQFRTLKFLYDKILEKIPTIPTASIKIDSDSYKKLIEYRERMHSLYDATGIYPAKAYQTSLPTTPAYTVNAGFIAPGGVDFRAIITWSDAWRLGPFYGIFVFPISRLTLSIIGWFPFMAGFESILAIIFVVIVLRSIAWAISWKSTIQQVKQQELSAKRAQIEAKYLPYKENKQMQRRKQQELQEMYKKEGINPLGAIGATMIAMPIFLSMWRIISATPHLKSTHFAGVSFAEVSYKQLFAGQFVYLPLMLLTAGAQGFSVYLPRLLTKRRDKNRINVHQKEALKKANKTQNIMMAVFVFMALIFAAGVQVYWFITALWTMGQNTVTHFIIKSQSRKKKAKRIRT